jgi:hypothetical protein
VEIRPAAKPPEPLRATGFRSRRPRGQERREQAMHRLILAADATTVEVKRQSLDAHRQATTAGFDGDVSVGIDLARSLTSGGRLKPRLSLWALLD